MGVKTYARAGASIYRTPRWKAVRLLAKRRDGFKCVSCRAVGDLEVDHIQPLRSHPELAYELTNLQTLCVACHSRKTRIEIGLGETNPKRQAWRALVHELSKPRKETPCLRA